MGQSQFYIYGRRAVLEALEAGSPLEKIYVRYGTEGGEIGRIRKLAKRRKVPCVLMDRRKFDRLQRELGQGVKAQGVIALRLPEVKWWAMGALLDAVYAAMPNPLLVALDHIVDPQNFGAILRTCEAAGVQGVIVPQDAAAPITPVVWKTSAGAIEYLRLARVPNLKRALQDCKNADFRLFATSDAGDRVYTDADLTAPALCVFGSEHKGVRPDILQMCDAVLRIPLAGKVSSLNVSVACGVVLFEAVRQRREKRVPDKGTGG